MRRTTDLAPSWEVFEACPRCRSIAGEPCHDMRIHPRWRQAGYHVLANPHPGRKKIKK